MLVSWVTPLFFSMVVGGMWEVAWMSCSCLLLSVVFMCCIVCLLFMTRDNEEVRRAKSKIDNLRRLAGGSKMSGPLPPAPLTPSGGLTAQQQAAWTLFENPVDGAVPQFLMKDNVVLVGHKVGTHNVSIGGNLESECNRACHQNKYCTYWQAEGDKKSCTLKNRMMAGVSVLPEWAQLTGFEPLPECVDYKCADGYKSGVRLGMHPQRMQNRQKQDNAEGYGKYVDMLKSMHDSMQCNFWCKLKNVIQYISGALLFLAPVTFTLSGTAALATFGLDVAVMGTDVTASVISGKQEARTQEQIDKGFEALTAENATFMFHNIKETDAFNAAVQCKMLCDNKLQTVKDYVTNTRPGSINIYEFKEGPQRKVAMRAIKDLNDQVRGMAENCCRYATNPRNPNYNAECFNKSRLNPGSAPMSLEGITIDQFYGGTDQHCDIANRVHDAIGWHKKPASVGNHSDTIYNYFRKENRIFDTNGPGGSQGLLA